MRRAMALCAVAAGCLAGAIATTSAASSGYTLRAALEKTRDVDAGSTRLDATLTRERAPTRGASRFELSGTLENPYGCSANDVIFRNGFDPMM